MCCGVVWCGVMWCGVPKAVLPKGNGEDVLLTGIAKRAGVCVCVRALCGLCVRTCAAGRLALTYGGSSSKPPGDPFPLRLLVQL